LRQIRRSVQGQTTPIPWHAGRSNRWVRVRHLGGFPQLLLPDAGSPGFSIPEAGAELGVHFASLKLRDNPVFIASSQVRVCSWALSYVERLLQPEDGHQCLMTPDRAITGV
jgi:hypothetical protein